MVTYKDSGVDIAAGEALVQSIRKICPDIGGFGGLYPLGNQYLVAGADGVGTKLKVAIDMDCHSSVGIDLVAMNVNDILVSGARPLFFLDYFATSKLDVKQAREVIKGIHLGCQEAGCLLLGGETAEMPGFYQGRDYDLAGFAVGIVDKSALIDGSTICEGDALVGITSSGLHSNGFSLARKILEISRTSLDIRFEGSDQTFGEVLLTPTKIYVKTVDAIRKRFTIKGMAHITGGGITENTPRMLPKGLSVSINRSSWEAPRIFHWLQEKGCVTTAEMYRTFNMGIGLIMAMDRQQAAQLAEERTDCAIIGSVIKGEEIVWC